MLDKISNINANEKYTGGSNKHRHSPDRNSSIIKLSNHEITKDSITFSAAAKYLTQEGWRLNKFTIGENRDVFISLSIYDLDFSVVVSSQDFILDKRQKIDVIEKREYLGNTNKTKIKFSISKSIISGAEHSVSYGITGIKSLFDRVHNSNIKSGSNENDAVTFNYLIDGFEGQLYNDFHPLLYIFYQFANALIKIDLISQIKSDESNINPIIIERILSVNV